jgi:integrase
MASAIQHVRGGWYVKERTASGKIAHIYLGKVTKAFASEFARRVGNLAKANAFNLPAHEDVIWAIGLDKKYQTRLRDHGFLRVGPKLDYNVETWIEHIITQTVGKPSTIKGLRTAKKHWVRLLGDQKLEEVTKGQVRSCVDQITQGFSPMHAARLCERGKMFFRDAVEHKLISENPFDGLKFARRSIDKSRQSYVAKQKLLDVVDHARHSEAGLLFLLARFAGLRVPSEPLALTWSCVDWEKMRISIPVGTKTGFRVLPIFPEFADELSAMFDRAESQWIFRTARTSAATTWRQWLDESIAKAKLTQWPKLWTNLRASCRTDLEERFPSQVCDAWLGHSTRVAKDHYLLVKPEHWEAVRTTCESSALPSALPPKGSPVVSGGQNAS